MKLDGYEIRGALGRGASATVFDGVAPDGRRVAIKVLRRTDPEVVARFEREARLLGKLGESDGFVPLLATGDSTDGPYLVLPLVTGGTLRERLSRGPLSIDETVALGRALALAIGRAHALGIVHRDLKPENILYTSGGAPLIADLGLGKRFARDGAATRSESLSRTGELRGTDGYMSPEQIQDSKSVGPPSDVFSIGSILHECLSGAPAFTGESFLEVLSAVVEGRREPLARPDAPRWLSSAIDRALAPDPARRFGDGAALARGLEPRASSPRLAIGVALAVAVAAPGVALFAMRPRTASVAPPAVVETPAAPASTPTEAVIPAICRPFATTRRAKLTRVLGAYAWKHSEWTSAVRCLPGGKRAITTCGDRTLKVWDLDSGEDVLTLAGHEGPVVAVSVTDDGKLAASAAHDGTVRVWDLATGGPLRTLRVGAPPHAALAVAIHPAGPAVVAGGQEGVLREWDLAAGVVADTMKGHDGPIESIAYARDRIHAASASEDGTVRVWDVVTGSLSRTLEHGAKVSAVDFFPDSATLVSGGADTTLKVWAIGPGRLLARLEGHTDRIASVAVSNDGHRVLSGGWDGTVRLWDVATARTLRTIKLRAGEGPGVAFTPDDRRALVTSGKALWTFDLDSGKVVAGPKSGHRSASRALGPSRDGTRLATGGEDGTVRVWDVATGRELLSFEAHDRGVGSVSFVGQGDRRLLTCGADGALVLWDATSGRRIARLTGHLDNCLSCAASPDGKRAVSASLDQTVRAWDLDAAAPLGPPMHGHAGWVVDVCMFPDGRRAASVGNDGTLRLWDLDRAREVAHFKAHQDETYVVALSADGERLLTGGKDKTLALWSATTPSKLRAFEGHADKVVAGAFSPDGRLVLSGSFDRTVRLWDVETGAELDRIDLSPSVDFGWGVAWAPDGRSFWIGTGRGVILHYELLR